MYSKRIQRFYKKNHCKIVQCSNLLQDSNTGAISTIIRTASKTVEQISTANLIMQKRIKKISFI